ncbi:MAG: topoisomerase IV [Ruminococcaceae bacterium]|nr:topoisomerase IV [Oscillospiraceae bacterium]
MNQERYIEQNIVEALETNYMPYAMSVIISRAIPEIDGFKPAHRKLLYTMYKMNLINGPRTKSSNVVGQTMKLNPHGDMAIYETMVRLTKGNGALLHPFVDSKGNFGMQQSRDMAFAAPRYTEVKLDGICQDIFGDIDKNTVDFVDNYDGEMKEPVLLPTAFPNVLVNPNQGIAVGMASNICSFNLNEVCQTTIAYLKDANCDLSETLIAPDFSTGGQLVYNAEEMKAIYETGRGSFKVRAKYRYDKQNNCIEIYEIPYTTAVEAIMDKIIELVKQGKIREIADLRDETDLSGLKLTLDLKRGTDPEKLMLRLFRQTPLEDSFSCNFNILIDGKPQVLGVRDILKHWTDFRLGCIRRRLEFDLDKKNHRLHLLLGLEKILMDIDKAVKIIRDTKTEAEVVPNLMAGFMIDNIQAEFIAEIKLRHLNKEYILKRLEDIDQLKGEIADIQKTLGSNLAMKKVIISELTALMKKYGKDRLTEIIQGEDAALPQAESFIEDYNVKVFLTEQNYLKKISLVSLRASSDQKLKEDDRMLCENEGSNKDELLLFSNKQNCYKLKVYDVPDAKASALGEYLPNLLGMEQDEKIIYMTITNKYEGFMLFAFENGKIAKVPVNSYETKTNRKKLANAYYAKSPIADIRFLAHDTELIAMSDINKILVFDTAKIPVKTTRSTQGVQVLTPKKGSILAKVAALDEVAITDFDYYRTRNLPARGAYLKPEDAPGEQMTLL